MDEMISEDAANHQSFTSEPAKLVAGRSTSQKFEPVDGLPVPPPVSMSLSLSSDAVYKSGNPPTTLRIEIINLGVEQLIVKTEGDQTIHLVQWPSTNS